MDQKNVTRRKVFQALAVSAGSAAASHLHSAPTPNRGPVKIGVVGGGFGSSFQWHLHPHCKVSAVCDLRPDRLQRLSEVYRCPNTYRSFHEFLKHPQMDAVAVFTPAPLHVWMDIQALKAGKHVIRCRPECPSKNSNSSSKPSREPA